MWILMIGKRQVGKPMNYENVCYWQERIAEIFPEVTIKMRKP
jgi:hypothetical protein